MANATEDTPVVQQRSGSRGCLYGCLGVIVGGLLLMLCAGIGVYWFVKGQIEKYTSTEPMQIPTVDYSEEQMAELKGRVDAFTQAIDAGTTPAEDLVLTAEEINALIGSDEKMRGKFFVKIENDQVSGDVSIPLDGVPGGKGRYFNGSASVAVSMEGGVLIVTLTAAEVNGEPVPQEIVDAIGQENLAKDMYKDPDNAKVLRKFESVSVEGDKLILKVRRDAAETEAEPTGETGEGTEAAEESPTDEPAEDEQPVEANA
jgi:hypothetical protein